MKIGDLVYYRTSKRRQVPATFMGYAGKTGKYAAIRIRHGVSKTVQVSSLQRTIPAEQQEVTPGNND